MKVDHLRGTWDLSSNGTSLRIHHQKFRLVRNGHERVAFLSKRRYGRVGGSATNCLVNHPSLLEKLGPYR
jgi:hypothetical protein